MPESLVDPLRDSFGESALTFQSNAVDKPKIRGVAKCTKGGNKYPPKGAGNHLVIKNAAPIGNSGLKAAIHLGKYVGRKRIAAPNQREPATKETAPEMYGASQYLLMVCTSVSIV